MRSLLVLLGLLTASALAERPNIVLIMCDDMGYSDAGCYGGEVRTPHIDAMAMGGVRFTRFTNTGRCCPSRASLLTGRYSHSVGMGWMTAVDEHRPGFRGQLSQHVPTLAEVLKDHGYATYMSGKWHLTVDGNYKGKTPVPNGSYPRERGFDAYYGALSGGGGFFKVESLLRNETHIPTSEQGDAYYYTHAITEHAVEFLEQHPDDKPFFLYLAHYAPHRPLEAPPERVDACRERYAVGYDALRQARYERLQSSGILSHEVPLPVHQGDFRGKRPAWNALNAQQQEAFVTEMATYAAMIEIMDDGIGEVVSVLKEKGCYDNTLFLFLSDNGATREGAWPSQLAADLSNTPFRNYKKSSFHGGTRSPLIVQFPKRLSGSAGSLRRDRVHINDIMPTCLEAAGIAYPATFNGQPIDPMDGISFWPALEGTPLPERDLFYEHQANAAVISDDWKLVKAPQRDWELFHLKEDPYEQVDLSAKHPGKREDLERKWMRWAEEVHAWPFENRAWNKRINHYTELNSDQDGID